MASIYHFFKGNWFYELLTGTRKLRVKKKEIVPYECPSCENKFSTEVIFYSTYFHFCFIPVFPNGKTAKARCTHCGYEAKEDRFGPTLLHFFKENKKSYWPPFYAFSWPILIILVILALVYNDISIQQRLDRYAKQPKPGDIYTVQKPDLSFYTQFRIMELKGDSVGIQEGRYMYLDMHSVDELANGNDTLFEPEINYIPVGELTRLYGEDRVERIDRN